jgi:hypothetical protein
VTAHPASGARASTFAHELAISAVPFDSLLVTELSEALTERLGSEPYWAGRPIIDGDGASLVATAPSARVVLVLHQRLWRHDRATEADAIALHDRLAHRPHSARVVTLDSEPVPDWLDAVPSCALTDVGVGGVSEFALSAFASCGGRLGPLETPPYVEPPVSPWFEAPTFLSQHRALSCLRHELDVLGGEVRRRVRREAERVPDCIADTHMHPDRVVARLGTFGLSFSWVPSGQGMVGDGRLLVIAWAGLGPRERGIPPLRAAMPTRERVYRPEADGPESWAWRIDDLNGRAFSTANLVGEWFASLSVDADSVSGVPLGF